MILVDQYTDFLNKFESSKEKNILNILEAHSSYTPLLKMAQDWEIDLKNVGHWMKSPEYGSHKTIATEFIKKASQVLDKIESVFQQKLVGEIRFFPSFMQFDGFARYDSGSHTVWLGVDHPDGDADYFKVLMAHELSHVFRDHQPDVWGFLGKPLREVTRQEYLENLTAYEHLVSEGLATLFSQVVFPEIPIHTHHFYFKEEMQWCFENLNSIDVSIRDCLQGDQNIWKFYEDDAVVYGSPSRVQYFWSAQKIGHWLSTQKAYFLDLIHAHGQPSSSFQCLIPQ